MMKKKCAALLTFAMAASMLLSACGGSKAPATAAELLKKNQETAQSNYHLNCKLDMEMKMGAMGMDFDVPVIMNMDMDVVDQNAHGNTSIEMSFMGEGTTTEMEMYTVVTDGTCEAYAREASSEDWVRSDESIGMTNLYGMGGALLEGVSFDSAEMVHDEQAKTYTVTTKMADLMANEEYRENMKAYFASNFESMGIGEEQLEEMLDSMGEADVTYVFDDSSYELKSVKMDDVSYNSNIDVQGIEMTLEVKTNMQFDFSDYGKIDAESVKVPDEVLEAANK